MHIDDVIIVAKNDFASPKFFAGCAQVRIKREERGQLPRAPCSEGAPRDENFCFK